MKAKPSRGREVEGGGIRGWKLDCGRKRNGGREGWHGKQLERGVKRTWNEATVSKVVNGKKEGETGSLECG